MVYTTHSRLGAQLSFLSEEAWIYPQTIEFNALTGAWTSRLGTALPEITEAEATLSLPAPGLPPSSLGTPLFHPF